MSTPDKEVVSGRVPADTHERFEEYREERGISKSDAIRRLIQSGLDAAQEEQAQAKQNARTQTAAEEWCHEKVEAWTGIAILSAVGVAFLFLIFIAHYLGFAAVPEWTITLLMTASLSLFVIFGGGALAAWMALRTGFARDLAQNRAAETEADEQGTGN